MNNVILRAVRDKFCACLNFINEGGHSEEEIEDYVCKMYQYEVSVGEIKTILQQIKSLEWSV